MSPSEEIVWGAVVVAAGSAQRFGDQDKLLAPLDGKPVLAWSIDALASADLFRHIVVVANCEDESRYREILHGRAPSQCVLYAPGGATRSASVRNGLDALSDWITHVAVHDGARPLVPVSLIERVVKEAERVGAAVPVVAATSTLAFQSRDGTKLSGRIDRERVCEIQTPQAGRLTVLREVIERYPDESDESSALLRAGESVATVPGSQKNIKITYPEDVTMAEAIVAAQKARQ